MKPLKTLALLTMALVCGCKELTYPPMATPIPTAMTEPTRSPTPITGPFASGKVVVDFTGPASILLAEDLDNIGLGALVYECESCPLDRSKPVLELALRGVIQAPCLARPCKDAVGLVMRYSANLKHDDTLDWSASGEAASQTKACGQGVNYHGRLAIGSKDPLRVVVEWTPTQITVSTPVDKATFSLMEGQRPASGSLAFTRWIPGLPWPRNGGRTWLWDTFGAQRFGVTSNLVSIGGVAGGASHCP